MKIQYRIHRLVDYINWIYFFHAWGFQPRYAGIADIHGCDVCRALWLRDFPEEERAKAAEAMQLHKEALRMLNRWDPMYTVTGGFRLFEAYADGDDLLLDGTRFPLLRQQHTRQPDDPYLCLSDFVRPLEDGIPDTVGAFATTVDPAMEESEPDDPYQRMLAQTLCDRLAEAAAECLHEEVRKVHWGYAPNEQFTMKQLHQEAFQGIRPAVGYPSLPDQSVNFLLSRLLDYESLGIRLTENGMMVPHASVSGLMFAHPQARYFAVGKIGEDQLAEYAQRRRMPVDRLRKFLSANL